MIVLIPAYEPDGKLLNLLDAVEISGADAQVVLVDDGSGPDYGHVFTAAQSRGCEVVTLPHNRGKGVALKAGFAHIAEHYPAETVVCADCDGQHRVKDILAVADQVEQDPHAMVLGVRHFTGEVPARSRFGNTVTRKVFALATGTDVTDTQTGLRGYPAGLLGWLGTVPGDRFEYELNLLLQAKGAGVGINEVSIDTVYLEDNASSHFRPIADSARIYAPLLKFTASSLAAFGIDFVALFVLQALTGSLLWSVVGARAISSAFNFATNRSLVFSGTNKRAWWDAATRYYALVAALLVVNIGLLGVFTAAGLGLVAAKVLTEVVLFIASFQVQRAVVYLRGRRQTAAVTATAVSELSAAR